MIHIMRKGEILRSGMWRGSFNFYLNRLTQTKRLDTYLHGIKKQIFTPARSMSSVPTPSSSFIKNRGDRFAFPSQILIYHAGTGRTVFLGCLKLTTIFICGFFTLVVVPKHILADKITPWVTCTIAISGVVPMLFVAYVSGPFVTYIHLRIPNFARNSKEMIVRFAKSPPKDTELDFTTMNFFGKPQVVRLKIKDIYASRLRFGMVNYVRDATEINKNRAWWKGKAIRLFGVHGSETGGFLGGEVWKLIKNNIEKKKLP